jgi:hypothetical protein
MTNLFHRWLRSEARALAVKSRRTVAETEQERTRAMELQRGALLLLERSAHQRQLLTSPAAISRRQHP